MKKAISQVGSLLQGAYNDMKELLSPSVCLACDGDLLLDDNLFCTACLDELRNSNPGTGPVCPFCGTAGFITNDCKCRQETKKLRLYYWGKYEGSLIEYISAFKFQGAIELGKRLAYEAAAVLTDRLTLNEYDMIIPVPLYKSRERSREYNQAEIIAGRLSKRLDVPMAPGSILRVRPTKQQSKITDERLRWANVENAFSFSEANTVDLKDKRILIVDDIVTTGATVYEASRPLFAAGVALVDVCSLAYAGHSKSS